MAESEFFVGGGGGLFLRRIRSGVFSSERSGIGSDSESFAIPTHGIFVVLALKKQRELNFVRIVVIVY